MKEKFKRIHRCFIGLRARFGAEGTRYNFLAIGQYVYVIHSPNNYVYSVPISLVIENLDIVEFHSLKLNHFIDTHFIHGTAH